MGFDDAWLSHLKLYAMLLHHFNILLLDMQCRASVAAKEPCSWFNVLLSFEFCSSCCGPLASGIPAMPPIVLRCPGAPQNIASAAEVAPTLVTRLRRHITVKKDDGEEEDDSEEEDDEGEDEDDDGADGEEDNGEATGD